MNRANLAVMILALVLIQRGTTQHMRRLGSAPLVSARLTRGQLLDAVRSGDFKSAQVYATKLFSQHWTDRVGIGLICVSVLFIAQYWFSSTVRQCRRTCEVTEAFATSESKQMFDALKRLKDTLTRDMALQNDPILSALDKGVSATKQIDSISTALPACVKQIPSLPTDGW